MYSEVGMVIAVMVLYSEEHAEKRLSEAGVSRAVFVCSSGRRSPPCTSSSWMCLITRWTPDIWTWSVRRSWTTSTRKGASRKLLTLALQLTHQCVSFRLPGDSRTRIGFVTFDSTIHFYNLGEGLSQPQMLVVSELDGKHVLPSGTDVCSLWSELTVGRSSLRCVLTDAGQPCGQPERMQRGEWASGTTPRATDASLNALLVVVAGAGSADESAADVQ